MSDDATSTSPGSKDKSEMVTPPQSAVHKANAAGVNPAKSGESAKGTQSADSTGTETSEE